MPGISRKVRRILLVAAVGVVAAGLLVVTRSASAQPGPGLGQPIVNQAVDGTGCLHANEPIFDVVNARECQVDEKNFQWYVELDPFDDPIQLVNDLDLRCLAAFVGSGVLRTTLLPCAGGDDTQRWVRIATDSPGRFALANVAFSTATHNALLHADLSEADIDECFGLACLLPGPDRILKSAPIDLELRPRTDTRFAAQLIWTLPA